MATKIEQVESIRIGDSYLVRIHTESGLTGLGQTACWGYPEAVQQIVERFASYLVGQDPFRIEHHWQANYRTGPFRGSALSGAVSAVDIALWDIKGKHFQAPVWELMGGRCRDRIRLHLLMEGGDTPDEVAAHARAAAAEGFTAIKFDPLPDGYQNMTHSRQISSVRDLVAAAREAVGDDVDLILEIHRKLTPLVAVPLAEAVAEFRPLFYEDPIQIDSIVSQAEVARRISIPVANGERLHSIWEFRELLVCGGPQYVRPDVGLAGGLTHCKKIAAIAESFHCAVVTHNFLGPVLTAASVHLDTCTPTSSPRSTRGRTNRRRTPCTAPPRCTSAPAASSRCPRPPVSGIDLDAAALAQAQASAPAEPPSREPLLRSDGSVACSV